MSDNKIFHAIGLNLHQPPGNMMHLIDHHGGEAQQIIHCYDRITRYAHKYPDDACLHVGFSGILLEQLQTEKVVERYRMHMDIPAMLKSYREAANIELLGMGYYHPVFSLIPQTDWEEQLQLEYDLIKQVFGRAPKGFCPPAMSFSMEMIPLLKKLGYEYVLIDSALIRPTDGSEVDPYRLYKAKQGKTEITLVAREVELSNAQQYGQEPAWFANEVVRRTHSGHMKNRLLCTWSDGENSEWFRRMDESEGYFGHFFSPYIEHARSGEYPVKPISLSQFIKQNPPQSEAVVDTPPWHSSAAREEALIRIRNTGERFAAINKGRLGTARKKALDTARQAILESETSCFLYWDDTWLGNVHQCLDRADTFLMQAQAPVKETAPVKKTTATSKRKPPVKKTAVAAKRAGTKAPAKKTATKVADVKTATAKPDNASKPAPAPAGDTTATGDGAASPSAKTSKLAAPATPKKTVARKKPSVKK